VTGTKVFDALILFPVGIVATLILVRGLLGFLFGGIG
jgi:hypothetical protein